MSGMPHLPSDFMRPVAVCAALCCSPRTLRRLADRGVIRQFTHPEFSGYFYSREDVERERARFQRVVREEGDE